MKVSNLAKIVLSAALALPFSYAYSQETTPKQETVEDALKTTSEFWVQAKVDICDKYLMDENTTKEEIKKTFADYFKSNELTNNLRSYLAYPSFHQGTDKTKKNVSEALLEVAKEKSSEPLPKNEKGLQSLLNFHNYISIYLANSKDENAKASVYDFYKELISKNKGIYQQNKCAPGFNAAIRAQAWLNLKDSMPLTKERKKEISELLKLTGDYSKIWDEHSIMIFDNNGFSKQQLNAIYDFVTQVPKELRYLQAITQKELIGRTNQMELCSRNHMVNVFNESIGSACGDEFWDGKSTDADLFTLVLAHEYNHTIDAELSKNADFAKKKDELVKQSGADPKNYLRSGFNEGFFTNAPQEFFASISNMYFIDSERSLKIAIKKMKEGNANPLNQFLFFADTFSRGKDKTQFYKLDKNGNLQRTEVEIQRSQDDKILEFKVGETRY